MIDLDRVFAIGSARDSQGGAVRRGKRELCNGVGGRVDLADSLKSNTTVYPFVELGKDAVSWYLTSNTYDNGVNDHMIKYLVTT